MSIKITPAEARKLGVAVPKLRAKIQPAIFFEQACVAHGLFEPVAEFRFHPVRRWRFDWAWPERKVAVEIDGGIWTRGRHTRGAGFLADMEKLNTAALLGWRVLRFTPAQVKDGSCWAWIKEILKT